MSLSRRGFVMCLSFTPGVFLFGCGSDSPSDAMRAFAQAVADGDEGAARARASTKMHISKSYLQRSAGVLKALGGVKSVDVLEESPQKDGSVRVVFNYRFEPLNGEPRGMTYKGSVVKEDGEWKVLDMNQTQRRLK